MNDTKSLQSLMLLVGFVFVWTLVVPGFIAFCAGVESSAKIARCLPKENESVKKLVSFNYEKEQTLAYLKKVNGHIDRMLESDARPKEIESLFAVKSDLVASLKVAPPARPVGFFEAQAPYYIFVSYFALLLNLTRWQSRWRSVMSRQMVLYTAFIYVTWSLPNWARNFLFKDLGRTIFSHSHIDISVSGFLSQELQVFGISFLIAATWLLASVASSEENQTQALPENTDEFPVFLSSLSKRVGRIFDEWQIASIVLGCAFLPFTLFYFRISAIYGDARYYSSALVFHFLWGITWWIVSIPVINARQQWLSVKSDILTKLYHSTDERVELLRTFVENAKPLSTVQTVSVGITALTSFLFPLLRTMLS